MATLALIRDMRWAILLGRLAMSPNGFRTTDAGASNMLVDLKKAGLAEKRSTMRIGGAYITGRWVITDEGRTWLGTVIAALETSRVDAAA